MRALLFATPVMERATTIRERAVDAVRHVAHASHEARLLKSVATDALEDGVRLARRAVKVAAHNLAETRDDVVYRIKREPLKAVGLAFGSGILAAAAGSLLVRACIPRSGNGHA